MNQAGKNFGSSKTVQTPLPLFWEDVKRKGGHCETKKNFQTSELQAQTPNY